jgi:chromosomal replication initiation ATPase DnaA
MTDNVWTAVCAHIRARLDAEDFRHWFGGTAYASDSGDQVTVWVPSEPIRRHLVTHYQRVIDEALAAIGRSDAHVRLIVGGDSDDEDEEDA